MKATANCLFCTAIFSGASPRANAQPADKDLAAKVDQLFAKWNKPDSPGCAVGIGRHGKLIYSKGFGSANVDYEVPNTPQTIFDIASAPKAFTSACLALLMDQGKIEPNDDLRKFVPEMHGFDPPIRIQDMIRCRTGLWDQFHIMPLAGWDNAPIQSPYSEADLLMVLFGQKKLPFVPGTQFHYGTGDYVLLGLVIKRITGKSLAEFARENLFEPLGMTRTYFETDPTRVVKNRAVGYQKIDGAWRQWRVNAYLAGGAGVKSCVEDLYRWDQNFYASRLPKGKYMDEFIREGALLGNRYVLDADAYFKEVQRHAQNPPAGEYRGLKRIQFTGGLWGMTAGMSRFPEQHFTVICLSNSDEIVAFSKTREIADLYLADAMKPAPAEPYPDEPKEFLNLPADELQKKTGAYRLLDHGHIWKLVVKDGDLHLIDYLGRASRLKALSPARFRPVGDTPFYKSARFLFKPESPGNEYPMTLESNENGLREVIKFQRVNMADPTPDELSEFAGEYVSEELSARYQFAAKEGQLWLRAGSRRWELLEPTVRDEFTPHIHVPGENRVITFRRDKGKNIVGFSISYWRIKGVEFTKR